jgi:hypothetical protein
MTTNKVVIAITKHGIDIANRIMQKMPILSFNSIRNITSLNREISVKGLQNFSSRYRITVEVYDN